MAITYRLADDVAVGAILIIERVVKNEVVHIETTEVISEPFKKAGIWYIPVKTQHDESGNIIEDRKNFVQVTEYTKNGMFKLVGAKLVCLSRQTYIITKDVFKLVNRRGSVRVPVSIESSFKIAGHGVWVTSTAIDLSLTGCKLRATVHNYNEKDIENFTQRKPAIILNFKYNDTIIAVIGKVQRASIIGKDVLELGCSCEDNSEYHRMCIAEQVNLLKTRRG